MTATRTSTARKPRTRLAPTGWHADANCLDMDVNVFFAPDGERIPQREAREAYAKAVCADCSALALCRDDAVARNDHWGVRGGLNPEEIQAERRRRQRKGELPATRPGACAYGHPRTEENTHHDRNGHTRCKPCYRAGNRASKARAAA